MVHLLAAHGTRVRQRHAPREVVLSAREFGSGTIDLRVPLRDVRGPCRVTDIHRADLAHGLRECRLRLLQRNLGIGAIERDKRLTGLHEVGVVGMDRKHDARDLRSDLHDVALDISVVGTLVVA